MKAGGIVLIVLGSLMILSSINLAFTKYHLSDQHDLSKFLGGTAFSVLLLAVGIRLLINKSRKR